MTLTDGSLLVGGRATVSMSHVMSSTAGMDTHAAQQRELLPAAGGCA